MSCWVFLVSAVLWAVVRADGQSQVNSLTGRFGENITLVTGAPRLHGAYKIIWSYGEQNTVLIHYDTAEWVKNATKKYELDIKTGSLTIRSLTADDSRIYWSQIFNGNKLTPKTFNLTVVGAPSKYSATPAQTPADHSTAVSDPDPNPPTGPPQNQTFWIIVAVIFALAALLSCIALVLKNREPIKGIFRGRFTPCDPEDPGRPSEQENERDTPV